MEIVDNHLSGQSSLNKQLKIKTIKEIDMKKPLLAAAFFISSPAWAADPSTSVYDQTTKDTKAFTTALVDGDIIKGDWKFFQFANTDSVFGSLSVGKSGDSQSIKFNAINYNLWFGGNKKLPFQLYLSTVHLRGW